MPSGKLKLITLTSAIVALGVCTVLAQETKSYENRHTKDNGLTCSECHSENPPSKAVQSETCTNCHGSQQEIAEKTKLWPNPHNNHVEDLLCEDCHHVHQPSVIYCNTCHEHNFEWKVP